MADNKDFEMNGEDFSQDVKAHDDQMNGGDAGEQNGSAEAPGRDDDRYVGFL